MYFFDQTQHLHSNVSFIINIREEKEEEEEATEKLKKNSAGAGSVRC